jgi:hypothetical protein
MNLGETPKAEAIFSRVTLLYDSKLIFMFTKELRIHFNPHFVNEVFTVF